MVCTEFCLIDQLAVLADVMSLFPMMESWDLTELDFRVQYFGAPTHKHEILWGDPQFDPSHRAYRASGTISLGMNGIDIANLVDSLIADIDGQVAIRYQKDLEISV